MVKASSGWLRAESAVAISLIALLGGPMLSAGATGSAPAVPSAPPPVTPVPSASVPALPTVSPDITDGQSAENLYLMALSLISAKLSSGKLVREVADAQRALDAAAVAATRARDAEAAADAQAEQATQMAKAAADGYTSLDDDLKRAVLFMYTIGPVYVTVKPAAGDRLAYAADYASTALTPGGILSTRRYDAQVRDRQLAVAKSAQRDAQKQAKLAADAMTAQEAAEASLESQLASVIANSAPQLVAEKANLASQAGEELISATGLEFTPTAPLPPPLPTTSVALGWAFSELGKPYVWGATGPAAFDCSGLTQFSWRQAGVDIPRVAADQDAWTVPVPLSQLLPGDLVFFGHSDIHHEGMYIGNGLMINAPHTGDVVRVSSIWWSDLAGFGRVHDDTTPVPLHEPPTAAQPSAPAVLPTPGPVPAQTQPPPGWQPGPFSTAPIDVSGGGSSSVPSGSTTTVPSSSTTITTVPTSTTTVPDSTTTVPGTTTSSPSGPAH